MKPSLSSSGRRPLRSQASPNGTSVASLSVRRSSSPSLEIEACAELIGRLARHDLDRAAVRVAAEECPLRSAQDLDPLDFDEAPLQKAEVVDPYAVDVGRDAGQAANDHGRAKFADEGRG